MESKCSTHDDCDGTGPACVVFRKCAPPKQAAQPDTHEKGLARVGRNVPLNVYLDDPKTARPERPLCQCHTEEDALLVVKGLNAIEELRISEALVIYAESSLREMDRTLDESMRQNAQQVDMANLRVDEFKAALAEERRTTDRLKGELRDAPHDSRCASTYLKGKSGRWRHRTYVVIEDCSCWKKGLDA